MSKEYTPPQKVETKVKKEKVEKKSAPSVYINSFVRRQTPESQFSHFDGTDEQLIRAIKINWHLAKQGYREGVVLIEVAPGGFYTGLVRLKPGDKLVGSYEPRKEGEEPRKNLHMKRVQSYVPRKMAKKVSARAVEVVLYSHSILAENDDHESDCDYEVISINARPFVEELPIAPMTLIANHFELDGGTATNMSAETFETALKLSVLAWKGLATIEPEQII